MKIQQFLISNCPIPRKTAIPNIGFHIFKPRRILLRTLLDLELLMRRHPDSAEKWEPVLRQAGVYRFSRVMLCATDMLLATDRP